MFFPDIAPSRSECQRQILNALRSPGARVYVDASVLIHCYEMSRSACEELLGALDGFGDRVRVPVWAAKETWDHTRALPSRKPLSKVSGSIRSQLSRFRSESLRYVDERTFDDMNVERFTTDVDALVAAGEALSRRTERLEPGHADANARLLPFIASHALSSDMPVIYDEVERTGEQRYAHEVPPGFGDGGSKSSQPTDDEAAAAVQPKGKKRNRFGDLIMWLEALQDCGASGCEQLVILTRDNTKSDWVYNPERVRDDEGRLQDNGGLVTLPLPLLTQEARKRCAALRGVHVISLEMFTQLVRTSLGGRVGNLVRALQSGGAPRRLPRNADRHEPIQAGEEAPVEVSFGSADMMFEPGDAAAASPIWGRVAGLRAEGWSAQNEAAEGLAPLLVDAAPDEAKQVGRAIVAATKAGALGPIELIERVFADSDAGPDVQANLLVGMLAETYFGEDGAPRKPSAHPEIASALFAHAETGAMRRAYEVAVALPLEPLRRLYLALPGEVTRQLRVELQLAGSSLQGLKVEGRELLEADTPASRQIVPGGRSATLSVPELLKAVAVEFVVPVERFDAEGPTTFEVDLPERIGFLDWGPESGEQLR